MTEVREPLYHAGTGKALTRRSLAELLRQGFELLGGMERRELVQMLRAHRAPAELVQLVEERVPAGTRVAGLRGLWHYLGDLPLAEPPSPNPDEPLLQIGEVADQIGLSLRSVRYYDEAGLVHPAARSDGNFRLYSARDVERLRMVKAMKPMGLGTEQMIELVELIDRSAEPDLLSADETAAVVEELQRFSEGGDEQIAKLERDLEQARSLRLRIGEFIARCH